MPLPNRAHAFVRLTLYDSRRRRVSALHLVDLVGNCAMSGAVSSDNAYTQRPGSNKQRRAHSQQLISLNRIIADLASKHENKGVSVSINPPDFKMGAYKDSKLNKFLAPLIAGNNHTTILATVSTDADDVLDSLNCLRCTTRALSISTACHRRLNVVPGEIASEPLSHLLAVSQAGGRVTTLDPRKSPTLSPHKVTPPGKGTPHQRQHRLQEEARRARSNSGQHHQQMQQQLLSGDGGAAWGDAHELRGAAMAGGRRQGRPINQEEALRRRERVHFADGAAVANGVVTNGYVGHEGSDDDLDMASHEITEIEKFIHGRGAEAGGGGGGRQPADAAARSAHGSHKARHWEAGADKGRLSQSPTMAQFLRASEEDAYEIEDEHDEATFEESPPAAAAVNYASGHGGTSLRDEFREVMEAMEEQHETGARRHGSGEAGWAGAGRAARGAGGGLEEDEEDEEDLEYESMLQQLNQGASSAVKATGPGGHLTAQRAEAHEAAAAARRSGSGSDKAASDLFGLASVHLSSAARGRRVFSCVLLSRVRAASACACGKVVEESESSCG